MTKLALRFLRDDQGQDLIEYALLGGIITAATAALITTISGKVNTLITNLNSAIP